MVSCPECNEQFGSGRSLRRHYELYKSHEVKSRPRAAELAVKEFLNFEEVNKSARLKYLMKELPPEFPCGNIIPYITKQITLYEFLIQKCTAKTQQKESVSTSKLCKEITEMLQKVNKKFPQVHNYVLPAKKNNPRPVLLLIPPNTGQSNSRSKIPRSEKFRSLKFRSRKFRSEKFSSEKFRSRKFRSEKFRSRMKALRSVQRFPF